MYRTVLTLVAVVVLQLSSCHGQDQCYYDGDVRLSNPYRYSRPADFGTYEYTQGPVEVCYNNSYIGACIVNINETIGNLTCRGLGYEGMFMYDWKVYYLSVSHLVNG